MGEGDTAIRMACELRALGPRARRATAETWLDRATNGQYAGAVATRIFLAVAMCGEVELARVALRKRLIADAAPSVADRFLLATLCSFHRGIAVRGGHYHESLSLYRSVVREDPCHFSARLNVAAHWLDSVDPIECWADEARTCLEQAIELRPDDDKAVYHLGRTCEMEGALERAVELFYGLVDRPQGHSSARMRLHQARYDELLSHAQRSIVERNLAALPEISGLDPERPEAARVSSVFETHGASIMRGVLDPERLRDLARRFTPHLRSLGTSHAGGMWRQSDLGFGLAQAARSALEASPVLKIVDALAAKSHAGWSVHDHSAWYVQDRRSGDGASRTCAHQDHPVTSTESTFITVWMPLDACGPSIAPGLRLAVAGPEEPMLVREEYPRCRDGVAAAFLRDYLERHWVSPSFEPGDVLLFGPNVFHETTTCNVPGAARMSLDLRFEAGPSALGFHHAAEWI